MFFFFFLKQGWWPKGLTSTSGLWENGTPRKGCSCLKKNNNPALESFRLDSSWARIDCTVQLRSECVNAVPNPAFWFFRFFFLYETNLVYLTLRLLGNFFQNCSFGCFWACFIVRGSERSYYCYCFLLVFSLLWDVSGCSLFLISKYPIQRIPS